MILTLSLSCIIYITTLPMFSRNVNPSLISQPLHFSPPRSPHIRNISCNSAGIGRAFSFQIRAVSRKTVLFKDWWCSLNNLPDLQKRGATHREWDFGHPHTARRMKSAGNQGNKVLVGAHARTFSLRQSAGKNKKNKKSFRDINARRQPAGIQPRILCYPVVRERKRYVCVYVYVERIPLSLLSPRNFCFSRIRVFHDKAPIEDIFSMKESFTSLRMDWISSSFNG